MAHKLRRSALYLPASNPRALAKAATLPCDAVILDLEDAVAPSAKSEARGAAAAAIAQRGFGNREVVVRVNAIGTPWHDDDMIEIVAAAPDAILVPKVNSPADIEALAKAMSAQPGVELWAMIETCQAIDDLFAIAACQGESPLSTLVLGLNDLAKEMRARRIPGRAPMTMALSRAVTAARAHGLTVFDSVYNDLDDAEGLEAECQQGVDFGFDGKTLIHPNQIETCNRAFSPNPADVAWARAVVAAFALPENSAISAIRVEGQLAERLHLAQSEQLIAREEKIAHSV